MTLIPNWRRTLTHGYATWGLYAAITTNLAFESLPYLNDWIPRWLLLVILAATLAVRLVKQKTVSGDE